MLAFRQGKRKETIFIGGCTDAIRQIIDGGINQRFATLITDISAESVATLNLLNFVIDIRVRCLYLLYGFSLQYHIVRINII